MNGPVPQSSTAVPTDEGGPRDENQAADVLKLVAEEAEVSKRRVATGRVDVRTVTDTVDEIVRSTLKGDSVDVTRVPVDRTVDETPSVRTEGDLTIVPVLEEVLVIEKRLLLKEEVHIRRTNRSEDIETTVPLRRQRAVVERHEAGSLPDPSAPTVKDIKK